MQVVAQQSPRYQARLSGERPPSWVADSSIYSRLGGKSPEVAGSMSACDPATCAGTAVVTMALYTAIFGLSWLTMPTLFPKTFARLGKEPGACGYWCGSVCSTTNGLVNVALALWILNRSPEHFTTDDAFFKTADSCRLVVIFLSWTACAASGLERVGRPCAPPRALRSTALRSRAHRSA